MLYIKQLNHRILNSFVNIINAYQDRRDRSLVAEHEVPSNDISEVEYDENPYVFAKYA
jgi:hypothetical protein